MRLPILTFPSKPEMRPKHLAVDLTPAKQGYPDVRTYCGWRVARRNTTPNWWLVTCQLCLGKRDGLTVKALREQQMVKT